MLTNDKTTQATTTAAVQVNPLHPDKATLDGISNAYRGFVDKYDVKVGGPKPTALCLYMAQLAGCRAGSQGAKAQALAYRVKDGDFTGGSTAGQRAYAAGGQPHNNVGAFGDMLRTQTAGHSAKLSAGDKVTLVTPTGCKVQVWSDKAGHIAATMLSGPDGALAKVRKPRAAKAVKVVKATTPASK